MQSIASCMTCVEGTIKGGAQGRGGGCGGDLAAARDRVSATCTPSPMRHCSCPSFYCTFVTCVVVLLLTQSYSFVILDSGIVFE